MMISSNKYYNLLKDIDLFQPKNKNQRKRPRIIKEPRIKQRLKQRQLKKAAKPRRTNHQNQENEDGIKSNRIMKTRLSRGEVRESKIEKNKLQTKRYI